MFSEIQRSIQSILYERVVSPLYGTLLFSWLIINWKIPYLTLFVDEENIDTDKINYILTNFSDPYRLFLYPFIVATGLIFMVPYASNYVYKLHLKRREERIKEKKKYQEKELLTAKQSAELRAEMDNQSTEFRKVLDRKESVIEHLKDENQKMNSEIEALEREKNSFKILFAKFGNEDQWKDVTNAVQNTVGADGEHKITADNDTLGIKDPAPGKRKLLEIFYQVDGSYKNWSLKENDSALLRDINFLSEKRKRDKKANSDE